MQRLGLCSHFKKKTEVDEILLKTLAFLSSQKGARVRAIIESAILLSASDESTTAVGHQEGRRLLPFGMFTKLREVFINNYEYILRVFNAQKI
jgi:hypothetical protein